MVCAVISNRPDLSAAATIARASRPVGANGFSIRIGLPAFTASKHISGQSDGGGDHDYSSYRRIGDQCAIVSINRDFSRLERKPPLQDPFPANSSEAHTWQIMQEMVNIPAAMPAGTDETDFNRHKRRTYREGEETLTVIGYRVN
jgi:hypothetical protein